jgi:hypothetical protein
VGTLEPIAHAKELQYWVGRSGLRIVGLIVMSVAEVIKRWRRKCDEVVAPGALVKRTGCEWAGSKEELQRQREELIKQPSCDDMKSR